MKKLFSKSAEATAEKIDALEIELARERAINQFKAREIDDLKAALSAQGKRLVNAQGRQSDSLAEVNAELKQQLAENRTLISELNAKHLRLEQQLAKAVRSRDNNKASVERMKKQRNRLRAALGSKSISS